MKTLKVGYTQYWCGALCFLVLSAWMARGAEPTAFELIKEGNKTVGKQSQDKVIQIRSEKSFLSLTPDVWYVVYYDPSVTSKKAEVKFGAGRQIGIKRGWNPFGRSGTMDRVLDLKKLKYDSDAVIKAAVADPLVDKLTIKATQLWLENREAKPVWEVRLWAAKLNQPEKVVDIGELFLSAETGKVVGSKLHVERVR
jgi:hypothetical protein